jgi:hypothetical protein
LDAVAADCSLFFGDVCDRYWNKVGQFGARAVDIKRKLDQLKAYFPSTKLITEIAGDDVAKLVAWRRGHRVARNPADKPEDCPFVSNATVNRSTVELLQRVFGRAKMAWGVSFKREISWGVHKLNEQKERVHELIGDEDERLSAATRDDHKPFFDFVRVSGMRMDECLLRWSEVDWAANQIRKLGKGDEPVAISPTGAIRAILVPLRGHHPEFVFTYVARRTADGRVRGSVIQ